MAKQKTAAIVLAFIAVFIGCGSFSSIEGAPVDADAEVQAEDGGVPGNPALEEIMPADEPGKYADVEITSIKLMSGYNDDVYFEWTPLGETPATEGMKLMSTYDYRVSVDWSLPDTSGAKAGDYFTVSIPEELFDLSRIGGNVWDIRVNGTPSGELIATFSVVETAGGGKEIKVVFTDYVEKNSHVSGNLSCGLITKQFADGETLSFEFEINGSVTASGQIAGQPPGTNYYYPPAFAKYGNRIEEVKKIGDYYYFFWSLYINFEFNKIQNFSLQDIIPSDSNHIMMASPEAAALVGAIPPELAKITVSEYTGADGKAPEERYGFFMKQYNSGISGEQWWGYSLKAYPLADGNGSAGLDGWSGIELSDVTIGAKGFSAKFGNVTRPTTIEYYTISTIKLDESALSDQEMIGKFKNTFTSSASKPQTGIVYSVWVGGGGSGTGETYKFDFVKIDENNDPLGGANFDLYTDAACTRLRKSAASGSDGKVEFAGLTSGTYYFKESLAPDGYALNGTVYEVRLDSGGFTILGDTGAGEESHIPNRKTAATSITVKKAWEDADDQDGLRPAGIAVQLLADNAKSGDEVMLNADNDWSYTWLNLPEKSGGADIVYTVEEISVPAGYSYTVSREQNTITITNSHTPKATPTAGVILEAGKRLIGRTLEAGMFSFVLRDSYGNIVANATNQQDGSIRFDEIALAPSDSAYVFTIEEVNGGLNGILYDRTVHAVTISVATDGDIASAVVSYPGNGIVFTDYYDTGGGGEAGTTNPGNPYVPPVTPETAVPGDWNSGDNPNINGFIPIGDLPVPLSELPFVDIFDDGVPLASLPRTGGGRNPAANAAALITGGSCIAGVLAYRNGKKKRAKK